MYLPVTTRPDHISGAPTVQASRRHVGSLRAPVQNYGPLPSEPWPCHVHFQIQSCLSPYLQSRVSKIFSLEQWRVTGHIVHTVPPVLQQIPLNSSIPMDAAPSLDARKLFSPLLDEQKHKNKMIPTSNSGIRPRVGSTTQRTALE